MGSPLLLAACLVVGAQHYHVPWDVLVAIQTVEGGHVGQEVPNTNGSRDLGMWQINDGGLLELSKAWGVPVEQVRAMVRDDGCINVLTAAFKLHQKVVACGSVYCGIAWYNSARPEIGGPYREKVLKALRALRARLAAGEG